MPFSRKPVNIFEGLTEGGLVTIGYTFDTSPGTTFQLDKHAFKLGLFQQTLETLGQRRPQNFRIEVKPRLARGRSFTTGNAALDTLCGDALTLIELGCTYAGKEVQVTKTDKEHLLVLPVALAHISSVSGSQPHGAFRSVRDVTLSTRGKLTIGGLV